MNQDVNPMFAKFDQVLGVTKPTPSVSAVPSRADEIRAIAKQASQPAPQGPIKSIFSGLSSNINKAGDTTANALQSNAADAVANTKRAIVGGPEEANMNLLQKTGNRIVAGTHVAGDVASTIVTPIMEGLKAFIPNQIKNDSAKAADYVSQKVNQIPGATHLLNHINDNWDSLSPDTKQIIAKDLPNIIAVLSAKGVDVPSPSGAISGAKDAIMGTPDKVVQPGTYEPNMALREQNLQAANQIHNSEISATGDKVLTQNESNALAQNGKTPTDYMNPKSAMSGAAQGEPTIIPGKPGLVGNIKEGVSTLKDKVGSKLDARQMKTNIDAVNPDLSGKKLTNAYKQTVTGQRDITPSSIFKEQGLTPDQKTVNLGKRLSDLKLTNKPIENLKKLGGALEDTEKRINVKLDGDPELNYNADKPTLMNTLENSKKSIPREFSSIKDSKSVFNNVIDFAKETITKAKDDVRGLRVARTAFDNQAKLEYPNAFKEGGVDVKTPAGRAIKIARDAINEHLYNTAPEGSEIQNLIGRETDIFRAAENIAPKAAATHGFSLKKTIFAHPYISFLTGLGIDKAIKSTTGLGF